MLKEGDICIPTMHSLVLLGGNPNLIRVLEEALNADSEQQFELRTYVDLHEAVPLIKQALDQSTILFTLTDEASIEDLEALAKKFPSRCIIVLADKAYADLGNLAIKKGAQDFILFSEIATDRFTRIIQFAEERNRMKLEVEQSVTKTQKRYQDIFDTSNAAIYICDLDGNLINYNTSTSTLLAIPYKELGSIDIHNKMYSEKRRNDFLVRLVAVKNVDDFEIEIERSTGERRQCLITARMLENPDFTGYTGIVRDITEQKQAEQFKKTRDLAQESTRMKEQFLASISHEMRTPMNAILGMSNLVIKTDLNEEQYNFISSIKQSSEILLGVVNDILEISEIQNGKLKFENKNFDLHALLKNLINVMKYKAQEKDLELELVMEDHIPQIIRGDKLRLNQILYNLVGNAIKFTDTGHVKIYVINLNQNSYSVQIKFIVEDTGIGIPPKKIHAIFDSFTRIRTKDRIFEGTGLGLSIAKNLVAQQGGKIWATSELNVGSKFFFDLIFEAGDELEAPSEEEVLTFDIDTPFRLLLAEDNKMNQLVARKTLEKQWNNIDITIANNGQEAIDILEKERFDIILMDIQMPFMNGYEATEYIRKNMASTLGDIPILAMTAHAHISKDEKFKEFGMNDYVLKPFEPEQLFKKIGLYALKNK